MRNGFPDSAFEQDLHPKYGGCALCEYLVRTGSRVTARPPER